MIYRQKRLSWGVLVLAVFTLTMSVAVKGCGGGSGGKEGQPPDDPETVRGTLGPSGGALEHPRGFRLEMPSGALGEGTECWIRAGELPADLPANIMAYSPIFEVGPGGALKMPATVRFLGLDTLSYVEPGYLGIYRYAEGTWLFAGGVVEEDSITAEVAGFSSFVVGAGPTLHKTVQFYNTGSVDVVVAPFNYALAYPGFDAPLNPLLPPPTVVGLWPSVAVWGNRPDYRANMSLPQGSYDFCFQWESGEVTADDSIIYHSKFLGNLAGGTPALVIDETTSDVVPPALALDPSPPFLVGPCPEPAPQLPVPTAPAIVRGDPDITLTWNNGNDLDLWVREPPPAALWVGYANPGPVGDTGRLDADDRCRLSDGKEWPPGTSPPLQLWTSVSNGGPEHVYWQDYWDLIPTPPEGPRYEVWVKFYEYCGTDPFDITDPRQTSLPRVRLARCAGEMWFDTFCGDCHGALASSDIRSWAKFEMGFTRATPIQVVMAGITARGFNQYPKEHFEVRNAALPAASAALPQLPPATWPLDPLRGIAEAVVDGCGQRQDYFPGLDVPELVMRNTPASRWCQIFAFSKFSYPPGDSSGWPPLKCGRDFAPCCFALTPGPAVALEKMIYAGHDGGASWLEAEDHLLAPLEAPVTYVYLVTNAGLTSLHEFVEIVDDELGITQDDMTRVSATVPLGPGDEAVYIYEDHVRGDLLNRAHVVAHPVDEHDGPVVCTKNVTAEDTATVEVAVARVDLGKTIYVDHDGGTSCPGTESVEVGVGNPVTYCLEVTNTGETHLSEVRITDSSLGVDETVPGPPLAPGETVTLFYEVTITEALANLASVIANPSDEAGNDLPAFEDLNAEDGATVVLITAGGQSCVQQYEECTQQCGEISVTYNQLNCDNWNHYSGCAVDVASCHGRACFFSFKENWCTLEASYIGCVTPYVNDYLVAIEANADWFANTEEDIFVKYAIQAENLDAAGTALEQGYNQCRVATCDNYCAIRGKEGQIVFPDTCECVVAP